MYFEQKMKVKLFTAKQHSKSDPNRGQGLRVSWALVEGNIIQNW
jgi:hypothetical protein